MPPRPSELAVVGGGVMGMTLALRLRQQGRRVTLVEGAPSLGGLAAPARLGDYQWDRFYHVILLSDLHLRGLLDELELTDRLRWNTTGTGFYAGGRHLPFSTTLDFLRFPPLNLWDKARLAFTILHAAGIQDATALERVPVTDWLRRLSGRRTFERVWLPLLRSKLGDNYTRTSAAFIWAYIARLYAARRTGLKREQFGYVDGGYATILGKLEDRIRSRGVEVLTGRPVAEVTDQGDRAVVRFADGDEARFDAAVLSVPCGRVAALCPQLQPAERERLGRVVYQGIVCASVMLRKPLNGCYVTNITDAWVPFTGVIEMTALVDRERFGGHTLAYLPRYLTQGDPFWSRSDEEVKAEFLPALFRMYPHLAPEDVLAFEVSRAREVQALATLHYSRDAVPPLTTSLSRIFVANSAQIINGTLNVNETVGRANRAAAELAGLVPAPAAATAHAAS